MPCQRALDPESPWLWTEEQWTEELEEIERAWGTPEFVQAQADWPYRSSRNYPAFVRTYGRLLRASMSKADALVSDRMWRDTDVRHVLPLVKSKLPLSSSTTRTSTARRPKRVDSSRGTSPVRGPVELDPPLGPLLGGVLRPPRPFPWLAAGRGTSARARPGHGPLHRYRRIDGEGSRPRRCRLAESSQGAQLDGTSPPRSVSGSRGGHGRGWLLRDVRRAGEGRAVRTGDR